MRKPDFEHNLLRVLRKQKPERHTLFELFLSPSYYERFAGYRVDGSDPLQSLRQSIDAMANAGFDHVTFHASQFSFPTVEKEQKSTISQSEGMIRDWETFEKYPWPSPDDFDWSLGERVRPYLPEGMKMMLMGPGGMLENVIKVIGYEQLCIMRFEEPELFGIICGRIGEGLVEYYRRAADLDTVGFLCSNDDWGFNTQTFLSPEDMRKYIFPVHKQIADLAHAHGKPCILHSCGYFQDVIDDVIDVIRFDARHSYEDKIMPVEEAYERYHDRIAVLGGIDMDFLCRRSPEEIYRRAKAMIERTEERGCYALGSGNSIPDYVPFENFTAMTRAALE